MIQLISYAPYSTIKVYSVWCDGVGSSHSTFFLWQRRKQSERYLTTFFTVGFFRKETRCDDSSLFEARFPAVWVTGNFPANGCTGRSKVLWGSMVGLWVTIPVSFEKKRVSCRLAQFCSPTIEEIVRVIMIEFNPVLYTEILEPQKLPEITDTVTGNLEDLHKLLMSVIWLTNFHFINRANTLEIPGEWLGDAWVEFFIK